MTGLDNNIRHQKDEYDTCQTNITDSHKVIATSITTIEKLSV